MNSYTTIFFEWNMYQLNKHKLQNLRTRFNVIWNDKKLTEDVPYNEIVGIYKIFKCENRVINDTNIRNRKGATGLWSNDVDALKVVVFDTINVNESPPVLMIYKGEEGEFYRVLVKMCADIGCEIGKLIEDRNGLQVIFKRQLSIGEVKRIRDSEDSKVTLEKEFRNRILELKNVNVELGDEFIEEWKRCIQEYGYYNVRNLTNEIKSNCEGDI
ncbi:MAG: hypothetical protein PHP08_00725 [Candidatus Dojkabacteria bacterium]|nr:hypothetical protein [Candidatus Dojkabacteria bacterium]